MTRRFALSFVICILAVACVPPPNGPSQNMGHCRADVECHQDKQYGEGYYCGLITSGNNLTVSRDGICRPF